MLGRSICKSRTRQCQAPVEAVLCSSGTTPVSASIACVSADWFEGLNVKTQVANPTYFNSVNMYGVHCGGDLHMWESSGWIKECDPYGWFQVHIALHSAHFTPGVLCGAVHLFSDRCQVRYVVWELISRVGCNSSTTAKAQTVACFRVGTYTGRDTALFSPLHLVILPMMRLVRLGLSSLSLPYSSPQLFNVSPCRQRFLTSGTAGSTSEGGVTMTSAKSHAASRLATPCTRVKRPFFFSELPCCAAPDFFAPCSARASAHIVTTHPPLALCSTVDGT